MVTRSELQHITFAVCTNRIHLLQRNLSLNVHRLGELGARFMVIYDGAETPIVVRILSDARALEVDTLAVGRNRGLSWCRNIALRRCTTSVIVFLDDDVIVDPSSMIQLGQALTEVDAAGAMIHGPEHGITLPWFVGPGQLHYLAIHNPADACKRPWGACLGLRMATVKRWELSFQEDLGRTESGLASGDDTQICAEIRRRGGTVCLLDQAHVWHNIDPHRLSIRYLIRRAYWQGCSEVRRRNAWAGFRKEWQRNFSCPTRSAANILVAAILCFAVASGIAGEWLSK